MHNVWTSSEKKTARLVFDAALNRELADVMHTLKSKAAKAVTPDDMWAVEEFLSQARRRIDKKYDYRYSQLELVFGLLLREKRISKEDLVGLSEEKIQRIVLIASL